VIAHTTGAADATHSVPPHRKVVEDMIRAFPDIHVHNDPYPNQFGQGKWLTVISKITGTFTGELIGPDGTPSHRPASRSRSSSRQPAGGSRTNW
jgi:hypothetical protein